jgi:hypothetical protein
MGLDKLNLRPIFDPLTRLISIILKLLFWSDPISPSDLGIPGIEEARGKGVEG